MTPEHRRTQNAKKELKNVNNENDLLTVNIWTEK